MNRWVYLLAAASALAAASCGGGGGGSGEGGGGTPAPTFPTRGTFSMTNQAPASLSIGFTLRAAALTATASAVSLGGDFDTTTATWTLHNGNVVHLDTGTNLFGTMQVGVASNLALSKTAKPTSGIVIVDLSPNHRVEVDVNANGVLVKQVTPVTQPVLQQQLTWSQFTEIGIGDTTVPEYQRIGSLAYHMLEFLVLNQLDFAATSIKAVAAQETALQQAGAGKSVTVAGDKYPPTPNAASSYGVVWTDVSEPFSEVGPGDTFTMTLDHYWRNDPASTDDMMYVSGTISNTNYMETQAPGLGFGTITYNNVVLQETLEEPAGTFTLGGQWTINGTFGVFFSK